MSAVTVDEQEWLDAMRASADYRTNLLIQHGRRLIEDTPQFRDFMRGEVFLVWNATGDPVKAASADLKRVQAAATRIECIRRTMNPNPADGGNAFTVAVPNGVDPATLVTRPTAWVLRNVQALKIPGYQHNCVLVMKPIDQSNHEVSPSYFLRWGDKKRKRDVRHNASIGHYWGYDDLGDEGWQDRGVGNPEPLDIRGPDDPTLYDSLCPDVAD